MSEFIVQVVHICEGNEKTDNFKIDAESPALVLGKIRERLGDIVYVNILRQTPISQIRIV